MKLMRAGNQKTTISNKARTIEQICVLDPVKQNIVARARNKFVEIVAAVKCCLKSWKK